MRRFILLLALAVLPLAITGCRRGENGPINTGPEISRAEILFEHNRERAINGNLPPLQHDPELEQRSQKWAENMAQRGSLYHSRLNMEGTDFRTMGENIAMGYPTISEVVHGWMTSPGHRRNILNKNYTHAGFGYARKGDGSAYWCAMFGGR